MEFLPGGHSLQEQTLVYRALTEQGVQALQQARFSFTPEYEVLEVREPKTIKKDGTVVRVGSSDVLYGRGASSGTPGFEDIVTATVIFPKLEVGDEISLQLIRTQRKAWFNNVYAFDLYFSSSIATREANIAFTAPDALAVRIDALGLDADQVEHGSGGKTRRTWHYHSDVAAKLENDAAIDPQKEPHLSVGTLADYGAVAALYGTPFATSRRSPTASGRWQTAWRRTSPIRRTRPAFCTTGYRAISAMSQSCWVRAASCLTPPTRC